MHFLTKFQAPVSKSLFKNNNGRTASPESVLFLLSQFEREKKKEKEENFRYFFAKIT